MVDGGQDLVNVVIVTRALHTDSALASRRNTQARVDRIADALGETETFETSRE